MGTPPNPPSDCPPIEIFRDISLSIAAGVTGPQLAARIEAMYVSIEHRVELAKRAGCEGKNNYRSAIEEYDRWRQNNPRPKKEA